MPRRKQTFPQKMNSSENVCPEVSQNRAVKVNRQNCADVRCVDVKHEDGHKQTTCVRENSSVTMDWHSEQIAGMPIDNCCYTDEPIDLSMKSRNVECDVTGNGSSSPVPPLKPPSSLQALELKFGGKRSNFLSGTANMLRVCGETTHSSGNRAHSGSVIPVQMHATSPLDKYLGVAKIDNNTSACPKVSSRQNTLERARARLHRESSNHTKFICICGMRFESLYDMSIHLKKTGHVTSKENGKLADYPKLVRGQDMWLNRGSAQTREILKCIRCRESFKSLPDLTVHMMKTKHYTSIMSQSCQMEGQSKILGPVDDTVKKVCGPVSCKVCASSFSSMEKLAIHMSSTGHHKKRIRNKEMKDWRWHRKGREKMKCGVCKTKFSSVECLDKHLKISGHQFVLLKKMYMSPFRLSSLPTEHSHSKHDWTGDRTEQTVSPTFNGRPNYDLMKNSASSSSKRNLVTKSTNTGSHDFSKLTTELTVECEKCFKVIGADMFSSHVRECLLFPERNALQLLNSKFGRHSLVLADEHSSSHDDQSSSLIDKVSSDSSSPEIPVNGSSGSTTEFWADGMTEACEVQAEVNRGPKYLAPDGEETVESTKIFSALESMIAKKIAEKSKDMANLHEKRLFLDIWPSVIPENKEVSESCRSTGSVGEPASSIKIEATWDEDVCDHRSVVEQQQQRQQLLPANGEVHIQVRRDRATEYREPNSIDLGTKTRLAKRRFSDSICSDSSPAKSRRPSSAPSHTLSESHDDRFDAEGTPKMDVDDQPRIRLEGKYLQIDSKSLVSEPVLKSLESLVKAKISNVAAVQQNTQTITQRYVSCLKPVENSDENPLDSLRKLISTTGSTLKDTTNMATILGTTNLPNVDMIPPNNEPSLIHDLHKDQYPSKLLGHGLQVHANMPSKSPEALDLSTDVKKSPSSPSNASSLDDMDNKNMRLSSTKLELQTEMVGNFLYSHEGAVCRHCRRVFRTKGGLRYHMTSCVPASLLEARESSVKNTIQKHFQRSQFTRYYKWAEELSGKS